MTSPNYALSQNTQDIRKNKCIIILALFYRPKYRLGSRYPYLYKRDIGRLKINSKSITDILIIN